MKKMCWLATGGTIASRPSENGLVPGFTAKEMLEMVPNLNDYGHIDCYDIMQLDSTNLQPEDWQYIAGYIEKLYEQYDGFVITHGTDTLNWTCCALHYMLENLAKPVVVIGSQLTIEEENTDAKFNLNAAFAMASSEKNIELDKPIETEYAVGDYLSEMYAVLKERGYSIDINKLNWEKVKVAVNVGLISRIFANLTDNICKYADIDKPIVMETCFTKNNFKVKIGNGICDDKTLLESTGIGLKSVDMMMLRMNGNMSYSREHGKFWVKLEFPIVK